jgi:trimeric autotransporter adhesin
VLRATSSNGLFVAIASNLTTTNFLDTTVNSSTQYYMVRTENSSGAGTNSSALRVVTGIDYTSTFIAGGSVWKFFDKTNDFGASWSVNAFNDSTWSNGAARLGFGNDGEVTKVASNRQWTTYFRREFYVNDPSLVTALHGRLTRDDGAVLYLNGGEVWRDTNMPSGTITNTTPALLALGSPDETNWLSFELDTTRLVAGWNLLAAEIHQATLTSSDTGFNFELNGDALIGTSPRVSLVRTNSAVRITWPAEASGFRLYATTNVSSPTWLRVTNSPVLSNNFWRVDDPATGSRFFELQAP